MDIQFQLYVTINTMAVIAITVADDTITHNDDINARCPYSDICDRNASLKLNDNGDIPCCFSCSCSPDCGLHMNCCYDRLDKYRLVESKQMVCINISNGYRGNYYMIDKCLDVKNGANSSKQCRTQGGKQNKMTNDLAPVSSLDSGFIYFNPECATCNNVHKFTSWGYTLECGDSAFDITSLDLTLQFILEHDQCKKMYVVPETEDWSDRNCYTLEPSYCEITDQWLNDMCKSIHAPYIFELANRKLIYRNIYCAMCDRQKIFRDVCTNNGKSTRFSLSSVIKGSVSINQLSQLLQAHTPKIPQAGDGECLLHEVKHPFQNNCRYIYCPIGMYRTDNGCDFYTARWLTSSYKVEVELKPYPDTKLMMSNLKQLGLKDRKNPKRWIRSSCIANLTALEVFSIVMEDSVKSDTVNILILRLAGATQEKRSFDPSVQIPFLKHCLREKWLLTVEDIVYPFSAEIYKYQDFIRDGESDLRFTSLQNIPPKLYETISSGPAKFKSNAFEQEDLLALSKLYFCEQVRLSMSEVEVGYDEIRILSHDLVLDSNEYTKYIRFNETALDVGIYEHIINLTTFAVCLEDFNQQAWKKRQQTHNNSKRIGQYIHLCMYSTTVLILMYCM